MNEWLDAEYLMPDGSEVDVRINLAHVRAFKRRHDDRALVLWAVSSVGSLTLSVNYDDLLHVLDGDETA